MYQSIFSKVFLLVLQQRKDRPQGKDSKTIKQLLGELYADKEYLEKLWEDTGKNKTIVLFLETY